MTGALYSGGESRELRTDGRTIEVARSGPPGRSLPDVTVDLDRPLPPAPKVSGAALEGTTIAATVAGAPGKLLRASVDGRQVPGRVEPAGDPSRVVLDCGSLAPGSHEVLLLFGEDLRDVAAARASVLAGAPGARAIELPSSPLGGAAVLGGRVLVGGLDGRLRSIDPGGGRIAGEIGFGARILVGPEPVGGLAVVATESGKVVAVDASLGIAWTAETGGPATGGPSFDPATGLCLVPAGRDLVALDGRTGSPRWRVSTGGPIHARPAVLAGMVFFGSWDGRFRAVDLESGAERWSVETDRSPYFAPATSRPAAWRRPDGSPAVLFTFARRAAGSESVLAADGASGRKLWARSDVAAFASPLVTGGTAIIAETDGSIHSVDLEGGGLRWSRKVSGNPWRSSPVEAGGRIAVVTHDGTVEVLDPSGGPPRTAVRLPGAVVLATPAVDGGRLYLPTYDGRLWIVEVDG